MITFMQATFNVIKLEPSIRKFLNGQFFFLWEKLNNQRDAWTKDASYVIITRGPRATCFVGS